MSPLIMSVVALVLALYVSGTGAPPPATPAGSRSLLRSIEEERESAVELDATNFEAVLEETSATYAIVEFFAHWCPACRHFKPHYERVAKLFNSVDAIHPEIILITKLDCAIQMNADLCSKFSVAAYPMLLWGPPSEFVSGRSEPKLGTNEIHLVDSERTADGLLDWINRQINSSYALDDKRHEEEEPLHLNASDHHVQIARAMHDIEESTAIAVEIMLQHKFEAENMISSSTRASLVKFFQLLVVHHPSRRCRKGISEILVDLDYFTANSKVVDYHVCGKDFPRGYWKFCVGSKNETRGFSCGLWILLHSLSVRVGDEESHTAFTTICSFIHNFFICEECSQHFSSMCSSVIGSFKTGGDFALWLWEAHNEVNERLIASLGTDDPEYPKAIWPSPQLCPSCYTKGHQDLWDYDEVYGFLVGYYKDGLSTPYTGDRVVKETSLVDVAFRATLAIVTFLALAYYIRRLQKSLKSKHHRHALKRV